MSFDPTPHLIKMKGGALYLPVKHRLIWAREQHPDMSIEVELLHLDLDGKLAVVRATVTLPNGTRASDIGSETEKDFPAGWVEKAATKAVGRALASLGFGTQFALELDEGERVADSPVQERSGASREPAPRSQGNGNGTAAPAHEHQGALVATSAGGLAQAPVNQPQSAREQRPSGPDGKPLGERARALLAEIGAAESSSDLNGAQGIAARVRTAQKSGDLGVAECAALFDAINKKNQALRAVPHAG